MKKLIPAIIAVIIIAVVAIIVMLNNANNANNINNAKKDPINSTSGEIIEVTNNTSGEENKEENKNTLEDYLNDQVWLSENLFITSGQCDVGLTQTQQVHFIKTSDNTGFLKIEVIEPYGIDEYLLIGMDNGTIKIVDIKRDTGYFSSFDFAHGEFLYDTNKNTFYYCVEDLDGDYIKQDVIFTIDGFDVNIIKQIIITGEDNDFVENNKEVEQMLEGYDFKKIDNKLCTIYYPEIYKKDSKYDF
ncbi:MAG: hypothetical protein IKI57_07140 [Clostridia bacterium]|nr:hypothetical protein [Clostridia bacterium]